MSSKAITEKKDGSSPEYRWQAPAELAPSGLRGGEPTFARLLGVLGLALLIFGGVALAVHLSGRGSWVGPTVGGLVSLLGLALLLFHAANDADLQVRRAYMFFGLAWLAAGAVGSVVPIGEARVGDKFLPFGFVGLLVGYLFLLAFVRNETEAKTRDLTTLVLGGVGAALALLGFVGGAINAEFLVSHGLLLVLLGLLFLWAFVRQRGVGDDLGYYAAVAIGGLGAAAMVYGLGRSLPHILAQTEVFSRRGWFSGWRPYLMPTGLLLFQTGLVYLFLALLLASDRPYFVMTRRQLGALFHAPVAYFLVILFACVAFIQFFLFVYGTLAQGALREGGISYEPVPEPIVTSYLVNWFPVICFLFSVPILTMNLLAEERRSGTLEMTLTAPQEETTVVLSKFTAGLIVFLATWLPWAGFLVGLRVYGGAPFDYQPFLAWTLALVLTGAGFVAMGLFFSSVTSNGMTAFAATFVVVLGFVALFLLKRLISREGEVLHVVITRTNFIDTWFESLRGSLPIGDLVYHTSVAVFWLFLTVKVLESRKWR